MSPSKMMTGVLKNELDPALAGRGYRRSKDIYLAIGVGLTALIEIQRSRWNDRSAAQFTFNGGIYVPGTLSRYLQQEEPIRPTVADCCISVRIGMLDQSKLDRWWTLTATDGDMSVQISEMAVEVREQVCGVLVPFLATFQTVLDVADFLALSINSSTQFIAPQAASLRAAYASLIYSKNGNQALALDCYAKAVREAQGMPNEAFVKRLGSVIECC